MSSSTITAPNAEAEAEPQVTVVVVVPEFRKAYSNPVVGPEIPTSATPSVQLAGGVIVAGLVAFITEPRQQFAVSAATGKAGAGVPAAAFD